MPPISLFVRKKEGKKEGRKERENEREKERKKERTRSQKYCSSKITEPKTQMLSIVPPP